MADRISHTAHGDAPLATAFAPDARAAGLGVTAEDDELIVRTVTIDRAAADLYAFWRDFTNLPRIMTDVRDIQQIDARQARWTMAGPGDKQVEWISEVIEDVPARSIAWQSIDRDEDDNRGRIEFRPAPAGRGTEVTLTLAHEKPGLLRKAVEKLTQHDPAIQARRALRRLKQLMETGEISTATATRAAPRD